MCKILFQIGIVLILAVTVIADKKIELQDIEEDNLKSEKKSDHDKTGGRSQQDGPSDSGVPLEILKNSFLQYYQGLSPASQQQRYVQQYAVSEQPERISVSPKPEYGPPPSPPSMVEYLSNLPVQFILVPQYSNQHNEQEGQSGLHMPVPTVAQVYSKPQQVQQTIQQQVQQPPQQQVQHQSNYIEIPAYVTPTAAPYVQPYPSPVTYISYSQPTIAPVQPTVSPVFAYQAPLIHYQNAISSPPQKGFDEVQQYKQSNIADQDLENEIEGHRHYLKHQEISKPSGQDFPRYYNSRVPIREEYRSNHVQLPQPGPLILKATPSHLAHIPKTLPVNRPLTKPVYTSGRGFIPNSFSSKPSEVFSHGLNRRPTSLLDSYIPSSLQIEYLKRGLAADPLSAYEALSSGRHLAQSQFIPRHYERGFLPNQIYHTAAGGIAFGHHKRAPK